MKILLLAAFILSFLTSFSYAQMSGGQGGAMMGDGWGWGMNTGWFVMIIIAFLAILAVVYMMKRK
jgi:hypothetical protein